MAVSPVSGSNPAPQQSVDITSRREERLDEQKIDQQKDIEEKRLEDTKRIDDERRDRELRQKDEVRGQNLDVTA